MPERALSLAIAAARQVGLSARRPTILRRATSVLVELTDDGVVARVEPAGPAAWRQWRVARFFAECEAPTARLWSPDAPPYVTEDGAVTLWHRYRHGPELTAQQLGQLLRTLHSRSRQHAEDAAELPEFVPFAAVDFWLARLPEWLDDDTRRLLAARDRELREQWRYQRTRDPLGFTIIHGDVHEKNVMYDQSGPLLIDLEYAGQGPLSWDLISQALAVRRYGQPVRDYRSFLASYGVSPDDWRASGEHNAWAGFMVFCRIYELMCLVWLLGYSVFHDELIAEARLRLDSFLGGGDAIWTLF